MAFVEAIATKRDGGKLSLDQIAEFVDGASGGSMPPEQLAAMLMAICCRGMDGDETVQLTDAMRRSGDDWRIGEARPDAVDKHSTGGVGDTVSLIFAPLMAAVGVPVAMMAGRGLGHSQGTVDKLEALPGFRLDRTRDELLELLDSCGAAIVAQTAEIAPADRTLYALRDVTGTVPSLPLIVGSIMSKKLALGAATLILDVKWGSGAFRKTLADGVELATALRDVARASGVACEAVLTDMNQPLGPALGTACEVRQALEILSGGGSHRLREVTMALAEEALALRGRSRIEARADLVHAIEGGDALAAWERMVIAHGGDPDTDRLARPRRVVEVTAAISGTITAIRSEGLGWAAVEIGAGRRRVDDQVDHGAGIEIDVELGDRVAAGQPLARLLIGERPVDEEAMQRRVASCFVIGDDDVEVPPLVVGTVEVAAQHIG